jgi:hypothetical protein
MTLCANCHRLVTCDYLSTRLHDEAETWLEYFMTSGDLGERLRSNFLTRPPQR